MKLLIVFVIGLVAMASSNPPNPDDKDNEVCYKETNECCDKTCKYKFNKTIFKRKFTVIFNILNLILNKIEL